MHLKKEFIFYSQKQAATDFLWISKDHGFSKNLYCSTQAKKKVTYILDGLRVSKLTAIFYFWVNYPFYIFIGIIETILF